MAEFIYHAKTTVGEDQKGEVKSPDVRSAAQVLRKKGLIVISIKAKSPPIGKFLDGILNRVSFSDLVVITRQLATMISAGLVLSEALDILEEQEDNKKLKKALEEIG